jgi:hypothetical protein
MSQSHSHTLWYGGILPADDPPTRFRSASANNKQGQGDNEQNQFNFGGIDFAGQDYDFGIEGFHFIFSSFVLWL